MFVIPTWSQMRVVKIILSSLPSTSSNAQSLPLIQPLLSFLNEKIEEKFKSNRVNAIISVRHYLDNENDPMMLSICASRYLCIPAISTESERMFSQVGLITSDRRAALKAKNVNKLLFLNDNKWIIDE
nr:uncharacterized protein LOC118682361 [Bactrocera oleae]